MNAFIINQSYSNNKIDNDKIMIVILMLNMITIRNARRNVNVSKQ